MLSILGNTMALLRRCRVNAALTIQLFSQLFHYINMSVFNRVVTPGAVTFCSRSAPGGGTGVCVGEGGCVVLWCGVVWCGVFEHSAVECLAGREQELRPVFGLLRCRTHSPVLPEN